MSKDIISRYVWIVDTLNRYGKLTRRDLNSLWLHSSLSDGNEIPERTFFHYRRAIEENFHLDIKCNSRGEYYIDDSESTANKVLTNWLLDSYAVNTAMQGASLATERVAVEDIPSAREFLPAVLDAITAREKISFTYAGFNRARPEKDIVFSPCFVKLYKQRWYMVGIREKSGDIRTYALDRIKELTRLKQNFEMPADLTPDTYFANTLGITMSRAKPRIVKLRTNTTQAKYLRALPLHSTQQEELHDDFSIFTYRLKINYELVHEILGYGNNVEVLAPAELRLMVLNELRETLAMYEASDSSDRNTPLTHN